MNTFIIGTCETMCPGDEIEMRTREKLLHFFEINHADKGYKADRNRVVKEFSRSAAGMRVPQKHDLRTPKALEKTIEYLLTEILLDGRKPFNFVYDFIFDRLRAIRQEIVMQNLDIYVTIKLLEPIVLFLAYSAYRLVIEPLEKYDPKICHQHLQECLKKALSCYDELDLQQLPGIAATEFAGYDYRNRELIESVYLLFNLGSAEALSRMFHVPKLIRTELYADSLRISISFWDGNTFKCLAGIGKLPHILCAIASLKIQTIRRELLLRFSVAYQSKVLTVPLDWLKNVLNYSSLNDVLTDCKYYNIKCEISQNCVRFNRSEFDAAKPIAKSRHEVLVNEKLQVPIHSILTLKDLYLD